MNLKSVRCSANGAEPAMMSAEDMVAGAPRSRELLEACLVAIIAKAGGGGLSKAEVTRRTQFVDHRRRNTALAELIKAGRIVAVRQGVAPKPIVLRLVGTSGEGAPDSETVVPLAIAGPPQAPVILALDLGQKTGWAVRNRDGAIASGVHEFRPGRFEGGGMIWLRFRAWLHEIDQAAGKVGLVVFEEVRRHAGTAAGHAYGGYLAHLTAWAEANRIPYQGVPVGTIKRHIAGKGNADKAAVIAAVKALGFDPRDDNEADALALLDWAICQRLGDPGVPSALIAQKSPGSSRACKRPGTVLAPRAGTTSRKTASD